MSFKEFRELLILLYGDNIVSDGEFLLLYDTFKTKNPEFPHGNYERFDLDSMDSADCKAEFRVEKQDLPRLVAALQLSPVLRCEQKSICDEGYVLTYVPCSTFIIIRHPLLSPLTVKLYLQLERNHFFFHHGNIKLLSALFSFTNRPFRLKKSLRYVSRN